VYRLRVPLFRYSVDSRSNHSTGQNFENVRSETRQSVAMFVCSHEDEIKFNFRFPQFLVASLRHASRPRSSHPYPMRWHHHLAHQKTSMRLLLKKEKAMRRSMVFNSRGLWVYCSAVLAVTQFLLWRQHARLMSQSTFCHWLRR
jgi:hypothetical protein